MMAPFNTDLSKIFVSCNIPLFKVEHTASIDLMEKYTKKMMSCRITLINCMEEETKNFLKKIKQKWVNV